MYLSKVDFFVAEGARDKDRQARYFATGSSKVQWPDSFHDVDDTDDTPDVSLAVDTVPWVDSKAVWSCETPEEKAAWRELIKAIKKAAKILDIPLEWGFDLWKWDRPHWQLTSYRK